MPALNWGRATADVEKKLLQVMAINCKCHIDFRICLIFKHKDSGIKKPSLNTSLRYEV